MTTPTSGENHPDLVTQVNQRRDELNSALTGVANDDAAGRASIETALSTLAPMLTGDLKHVPDMVSRDLVRWLEANKHVGVKQVAEPASAVTVSGPGVVVPAEEASKPS